MLPPRFSRVRAVAAACLWLGACSGWRSHGDTFYGHGGKKAPREATYAFGNPGGNWRPAPPSKHLQVAWIHHSRAATIRIHSECSDHGDGTLEQFLDHLRIGWTQWQVLETSQERMADRAALRAVVTAELDGVTFKHEFVILKKNGCLFDLSYSARPEAFPTGRGDFLRVVSGFRFPVG